MRRFAVFTALLTTASIHVATWGGQGHQIVADLAVVALSQQARDEVSVLLDGATLASVSSDADEVRHGRPETRRWHFVDIPRREAGYVGARDCAPQAEGDCVIAAIERARIALADRGRPQTERAKALKLLVHFVGDLHQPLHAVDDNDFGGNKVRVTLFGRPMNLHSVWDSGLLDHTHLTMPEHVERLRRLDVDATGTPVQWADEAHRAAIECVYALPDDLALDEAYYDRSRPTVDLQLARAGARLGRLLNETLGR